MTLQCAHCGKTPDRVTGEWWRHVLACDVVEVERIRVNVPQPGHTGYGAG